MNVESKLINSTLYMGLSGELDSANSTFIRQKMDEILTQDIKKVIIDLSVVDFMDSTGIGVLLGRYKKLKERKIPIYLASPKKNIDKLLSLSGIYDIMPKI